MDSRALVAIAVGATGLVLGVLSLFQDSFVGLFAGIAALAAGIAGMVNGKNLASTETELQTERANSADLQKAVATQVQARLTAEEAVGSIGAELAATQASEAARTERIEKDIRGEGQLTGAAARQVIIEQSTGLFTEAYFRAAVEARVAAARRHLRPVAIILMEVTTGEGETRTQANPEVVADYILDTLRESDTACRTSNGLYALVLEDTPENGAVWTVERIRRAITEDEVDMTVWAGVACYPAHAFEVRDLVGKASEALEAATEWHQDRIEVAISDL